MEIRGPEPRDVGALMDLGAGVIGPERAGPFIRSFLDRHHILVAEREDEVVGFIAYRTDWFQCTFVSLGTWSVRDIVAHMSGWHRELGPALERLARGERPVPEGKNYETEIDAWNERFAASKQNTPVADVLLELDESHEYFMHAAAQVP